MKRSLILWSLLVPSIALVACNNGSTGSSSPIYLESGHYQVSLSNPSSAECGDIDTSILISSGTGGLCELDDLSTCYEVNLANNPCQVMNEVVDGVTVNFVWNSCRLTNTGMTAAIVFSGTDNMTSETTTCSANMTLNKVSQ